ncbi:MAG: hypothetical protein HY686_06895 [Chloroflexi bacterium]|nr:hypothetical protein [Chloroflexota bacterium]
MMRIIGRAEEVAMADYQVNPERVYHNFQGRFPPAAVYPKSPATMPPESPRTHPKLITDTTLRDGAQDPRFALFPNEAKLRYYDLLHALDNGTGRIEAIEVFIYQERDLWALEKLLERGYEYPQVTTWTRATPKDIKLLVEVSGGRVKETGMLASSSDHHIFDKLSFHSKEEASDKYLAPILTAMEHGIRPRIHLEDCTKADLQGWVIPFMRRVLDETEGQARFRICDTIGWGLPDPAVAAPFGIPKLIATLAEATQAELEFHGHNDFGLATANTLAAWLYGCKRANTAVAGLGERTGNTSLEQMVALMIRLWGDPGFNLEALAEIAELIDREVVHVPEKSPIVGRDIFTTQAGIHQTGVQRQLQATGGLIYLPYDPTLVGRQHEELNRIGALSGMDGLVAVLNSYMQERHGVEGKYTVASRVVKGVYDRVHAAYDGRKNPATGSYEGWRSTFFTQEELGRMAEEMEKGPRRAARSGSE